MGCQHAAEELISGYKITLCYNRQMQFSVALTGLNKITSVVEHWLQGREYEFKKTAMNDAGVGCMQSKVEVLHLQMICLSVQK